MSDDPDRPPTAAEAAAAFKIVLRNDYAVASVVAVAGNRLVVTAATKDAVYGLRRRVNGVFDGHYAGFPATVAPPPDAAPAPKRRATK